MIDQEQATKILEEHLADNLMITCAYENEEYWIFDLGLKDEEGKLLSILGSNSVKIRKEDCTIV